jgi:hypothetical protein
MLKLDKHISSVTTQVFLPLWDNGHILIAMANIDQGTIFLISGAPAFGYATFFRKKYPLLHSDIGKSLPFALSGFIL